MEVIVVFSDILIVTTFVFHLIKGVFGDNPLGRIVAVLSSIATIFISGSLFAWANTECSNGKVALIILFSPIVIFLLLMLLLYAFNGNTDTKNQEKELKGSIENTEKDKKIDVKLEQLKENSLLHNNEILRYEKEVFNLRKNTFICESGKLKVTDKNIIWYNHKKSIRIPIEYIKSIKSRNYFIFIPTGIQVKTSDKKYDFITMNRKEVLENINLLYGLNRSK